MRPARLDDAGALAKIHVRTWQHAYEHVFGTERLAAMDPARRLEQWKRWLSDGAVAFVAEQDGRAIGFVWVGASRDTDAEGELFAIYVLPHAWGTGAGTALMQRGVEAMREAGYRDAILWVLEDNPRARRFYEREGWSLDGERKDDEFFGVRVTEVRYRLLVSG